MRRVFFWLMVFVLTQGCSHAAQPSAFCTAQVQVAESTMPQVQAQVSECRAAILVYHHVNPHVAGESGALRAMTVSNVAFAAQMQHVHDAGYNVIPLAAVADCLAGGAMLREKSVVITLDDGWVSQYIYALPILEKYHFTATFFVVTSLVLENDGGGLLSWRQVKDLDSRGMTIGSHSKMHPNLTLLGDDRLRDEVAGSKKVLEDHLGKPVQFFAYPFGNVNSRVIAAVQKAGYVAARSTIDGNHQHPSDLLTLKVVYVTDDLVAFKHNIAE